jgi:sugar/nucleoside kinase (ribokinase family)
VTSGAAHLVVVAGSVSIDENVVDGRRFLKLGGVPVYAGLTYEREGLPVMLVANASDRDAGIFQALSSSDVHVRLGPSALTTRFENRAGGELRTQRVTAVARPIGWDDLHPAADVAAWVHMGPLHPGDFGADVYEGLCRGRIPVVLDLQGLVRRISDGRVSLSPSPLLPQALGSAAIVKSSKAEAAVAAEALGATVDELMERFEIREWVLTDGARGGRIHVRGLESVHYTARAADALDPTGAGDVFLAAYAAARLGRNTSVAAAGRHASAVSALQVVGRHIPFDLLLLPGGRR